MQHFPDKSDLLSNSDESLMQAGKTEVSDELVERSRQGDNEAFGALYHRHSRELYNTICRLVGHTAEAEDLLQESFITAYQALSKLDHQASFGAWIKRIAINKSITLLRRRKARFVELDPERDPAEEEGVDEMEFELKVEEIKKAINKLPEGYRTVVNLYLIEDIPQEEIAGMLGISYNTVRTQYHRAKARIWESLKKGGIS
jgi:RNA polymerase sigma factor (sigma-70 family)